MTKSNLNYKQTGVTIIELMVALMLGLLLTAGVVQVYLGSKAAYRTTQSISRVQENTRNPAELLAKDIRMAGYIPCSQPQNSASIVDSSEWWTQLFRTPIRGFEGDISTTLPATNLVVDAKVGSDAIMILRGGPKVASVKQYDSANNQFLLQRDVETNWVENGSLMLACDSLSATLFQANDIGTNTITLADNTAAPGNSGNISQAFGSDAQVANYHAVIYYIRSSPTGDGFSLYRSYLNVNSASENAPVTEELAEGVENMQLLYGYDLDGNGVAERYLKANHAVFGTASNWRRVTNVRIGLLYASDDGLREGGQVDSNTYVVANTAIGVGSSTSVTHEQDQRKRYVASMTVSLRNL